MELSDVYMVTGSLDNRPVLVRFNRCQLNNMHRDMAITAQMNHLKNVLRLVGCCLEFEEPAMVYEYVEGISLSDLLYKKGNINRKSSLSWGNRLRIANEVASAIVFLHTEFTTPIIHRDIASSKVIIDQNSGVAKILDFSLSISLPPGKLEMKSEDGVLGTIGYIAPENGFYDIITQKIDVYSFGVLLFELLTGKKMVEMVDSAISKEPIDCEEVNKSNIEERNAMDTTFENLHPNIVDRYIRENSVIDIVDPTIFEEHGIEIQQQLEDYIDLVKRCTTYNGENRPYMIHVARELRRIEKCFRALTIG
ncbi:serine/threonine-protein kinase ZRK4-like [Solanum verrucosum]|uniref:serine/threonine-protein kinase ZRK4-like n=1 Tax=Solanum verrucosum TaxID=315347 RepID=UPI0020D1C42C|nr:serine/threonine-protein kinase ZRK4-like [Solanum verrucosum]